MRDIFVYKDNFATYADIESRLVYGDKSKVQNPLVSVVIPCYRRPDYLKDAIESALAQTFPEEYEIVVVDNNDTVEGPNYNQQVVESFKSDKILYYRNAKNIGMFGNWNRCIELARAPYIVYCHDDDTLLPDALTTLYNLELRYPGRAIFGAKNTIDEYGGTLSRYSIPTKKKLGIFSRKVSFCYNKEDVFISSPGYGCGCMFSKTNLIAIGGYNPEFYPSADYALNAVYIFRFGGVFSETPTFNYRIAENESLNVYEKFVDVDRHFRECMAKRMKWPDWLLRRIILANYRTSKLRFAVIWGKQDPTILRQADVTDKNIMRIIRYKLMLHRYTISQP